MGFRDDDLIEVLGAFPVPLRGWVRVANDVPEGSLTLDDWGQRQLRTASGDTLRGRLLRRKLVSDLPMAAGPVSDTGDPIAATRS